jgi:hypothetical protein
MRLARATHVRGFVVLVGLVMLAGMLTACGGGHMGN